MKIIVADAPRIVAPSPRLRLTLWPPFALDGRGLQTAASSLVAMTESLLLIREDAPKIPSGLKSPSSAAAPISGGLFMTTKPARSRCSTRRFAHDHSGFKYGACLPGDGGSRREAAAADSDRERRNWKGKGLPEADQRPGVSNRVCAGPSIVAPRCSCHDTGSCIVSR